MYIFFICMKLILFTAYSLLGYDKIFCTYHVYLFCLLWYIAMQKSDINNYETDYFFSANQYLMKSSLIVLNILFSINCVRLFSILFALSGSIKHFAWNDITGKFHVPELLGKFVKFHLDLVYNHFFNFSNLKF